MTQRAKPTPAFLSFKLMPILVLVQWLGVTGSVSVLDAAKSWAAEETSPTAATKKPKDSSTAVSKEPASPTTAAKKSASPISTKAKDLLTTDTAGPSLPATEKSVEPAATVKQVTTEPKATPPATEKSVEPAATVKQVTTEPKATPPATEKSVGLPTATVKQVTTEPEPIPSTAAPPAAASQSTSTTPIAPSPAVTPIQGPASSPDPADYSGAYLTPIDDSIRAIQPNVTIPSVVSSEHPTEHQVVPVGQEVTGSLSRPVAPHKGIATKPSRRLVSPSLTVESIKRVLPNSGIPTATRISKVTLPESVVTTPTNRDSMHLSSSGRSNPTAGYSNYSSIKKWSVPNNTRLIPLAIPDAITSAFSWQLPSRAGKAAIAKFIESAQPQHRSPLKHSTIVLSERSTEPQVIVPAEQGRAGSFSRPTVGKIAAKPTTLVSQALTNPRLVKTGALPNRLVIPVAITSAFDWQLHPITKAWRFHSGISAPVETPTLTAYAKTAIANFIQWTGSTSSGVLDVTRDWAIEQTSINPSVVVPEEPVSPVAIEAVDSSTALSELADLPISISAKARDLWKATAKGLALPVRVPAKVTVPITATDNAPLPTTEKPIESSTATADEPAATETISQASSTATTPTATEAPAESVNGSAKVEVPEESASSVTATEDVDSPKVLSEEPASSVTDTQEPGELQVDSAKVEVPKAATDQSATTDTASVTTTTEKPVESSTATADEPAATETVSQATSSQATPKTTATPAAASQSSASTTKPQVAPSSSTSTPAATKKPASSTNPVYSGPYIDPTKDGIRATQPQRQGTNRPSGILFERSTGHRVILPARRVTGNLSGPAAKAHKGITAKPFSTGIFRATPRSTGGSPLSRESVRPIAPGIDWGKSVVNFGNYSSITVPSSVKVPKWFVPNNTRLVFPLAIPVAISSSFGWRLHPISGTWRFHSGTDLAAPVGTPVVAAYSGKVAIANSLGGYGLAVVLDHNNGKQETLYGHLSEILAKPGAQVEQGDVIGLVGSTGNSTGPHLHFEFRQSTSAGWVAVDPGPQLEVGLAQLVRALQTAQASSPRAGM